MPHKGRKQPKRRENGGRRSQNANKKKQLVESNPPVAKSQNSEALTTYFKLEELQQIRSSLTAPDLVTKFLSAFFLVGILLQFQSGTPPVVAAAILNNSEMLKKLLRQGRNVNETGEVIN